MASSAAAGASKARSGPCFREMALSSGLSQAQLDLLVGAGIDTGTKLAFATSYQPGASGDDSALMKFAEE
eukprot:3833721-Amphidinium_carterae.1